MEIINTLLLSCNLQTEATVTLALNMDFSNRCVGTRDVGTEIDIKIQPGTVGMYFLGLHHKLENWQFSTESLLQQLTQDFKVFIIEMRSMVSY